MLAPPQLAPANRRAEKRAAPTSMAHAPSSLSLQRTQLGVVVVPGLPNIRPVMHALLAQKPLSLCRRLAASFLDCAVWFWVTLRSWRWLAGRASTLCTAEAVGGSDIVHWSCKSPLSLFTHPSFAHISQTFLSLFFSSKRCVRHGLATLAWLFFLSASRLESFAVLYMGLLVVALQRFEFRANRL
jgi:hypothetical protein